MSGQIQTLFPAMGTINSITLLHTTQKEPVLQARSLVLDLDKKFSVFRPESELSRLNARSGGPWVPVSDDLFSILLESQRCRALSCGAFDVTIGALTSYWKDAVRQSGPLEGRRRPAPPEIAYSPLKKPDTPEVAYSPLEMDDAGRRVRLTAPGSKIDLGGIAKGYAIDRLYSLFHEIGVKEALINLGGSVCVLGRALCVGIRNPFDPAGKPLGSLMLEDSCAVTSGSYERGFDECGVRYHHIIDPRTGRPSESGLLSVTLIGKNAAQLDGLATAAFILGTDKSAPLLASLGIEGIFVTASGEVLVTPGLSSAFKLSA